MIDAAYQMDRALESDPIANGNPLSEGLFYIDCPPLRAIYSIDADAKRVEIARIRRISQSPPCPVVGCAVAQSLELLVVRASPEVVGSSGLRHNRKPTSAVNRPEAIAIGKI